MNGGVSLLGARLSGSTAGLVTRQSVHGLPRREAPDPTDPPGSVPFEALLSEVDASLCPAKLPCFAKFKRHFPRAAKIHHRRDNFVVKAGS